MRPTVLIGQLKTGVEVLFSTKWRNLWTVLGIIIGVSSVIVVIAIGEGIKQQINQQIDIIGRNNLVVQPAIVNNTTASPMAIFNTFDHVSLSGSLTVSDMQVIQKTSGVDQTIPLSIVREKAIGNNGVYKNGVVVGSMPGLEKLLNLSMAYGNFLSSHSQIQNSVILGQTAATKMFNEDVPLGSTVYINNQPFIVEGILNPITNIPLSQPVNFNDALLINYNQAQILANNSATIYEIFVGVSQPKQLIQIKNLLQHNLNVVNGDQKIASVSLVTQTSANSKQILDLLTKLIAGVAAISLLVGGVGIMNVMLVSVAERTHEIGIRKAIGATDRQILVQFIMEASILSFAGGILGILLAYIITEGIVLATSIKPVVTWQVVLAASLISILIGMIFGSIPAFKAARKIPIDALRAIT